MGVVDIEQIELPFQPRRSNHRGGLFRPVLSCKVGFAAFKVKPDKLPRRVGIGQGVQCLVPAARDDFPDAQGRPRLNFVTSRSARICSK